MCFNDHNKKPMCNFDLGKMITYYVNNYFTDLELSDKIKTIIDNQFDNLTKYFFQKQLAWYLTAFVTPHFTLMFTEWEGTAA